MVSLDGRPGRLDATFRPDDSFTVNLTGPAGWLSSRAYTATLGGVALSVSENGDVLTVVASAAITAAATSPAQFVLTLTGGNDALVGTWSARTDGSAQTSTSAAVIIDSLDVAVTLGGDSADLNAHIADTSGAHAASAVSITDAAGDFTATDVEGALAELQSDAETDAAALATFIDTTAPGTYGALLPFKSGYHYAPPCTSSTAIRAEAALEVVAFDIGKAVTIDRLFAEVTVVGTVGALVRLGLYASTSEGLPGALVVDGGTIDGTSATVQSKTISQALTPGRYFIGAVVQGGAGTRPTTRVNTGPGLVLVGSPLSSTPAQFPAIGFTLSGVTGALPDPYGTPTGAASTAHRVFVRVA